MATVTPYHTRCKCRWSLAIAPRLWVVIVALWFVGCTPQPDAMWQDYRARLSRVLAITLPEPVAAPPVRALPAVNTAPTFDVATITLLDVARLRDCGLDQLISARNSSLGKTMPAAVALSYEVQLLEQLPACIALEQLPDTLRHTLRELQTSKLAQLPQRFEQLLIQDSTLRAQLQGSRRGITDMAGQAQTVQALMQLQQTAQLLVEWQQHGSMSKASQTALAAEPWRLALETLYQTQRLADLQHSVRHSVLELTAINAALANSPINCRPGQRAVMDQVLQQVFIQRIQTMLAQVDQSLTELKPLLVALYSDPNWRAVLDNRLFHPQQQLHDALKQHVRWWQHYQAQCPR